MSLPPGSRLGPYEIVAPLGVGGMGEVYRATDPRLGREVALKALPASLASDPERLARFEQEARTVAALNHPNIVTVYSIEDDAGKPFLTMELVEGRTLEAYVVPGGMPIAQLAALGAELCDALAAAHDKGIVHRDLKPANVMLSSDGRLKILDFGLAKLEASMVEGTIDDAATVAAPLSMAGQVVGTLGYMAPEQLSGQTIDGRTDIFALGVLLYELACGQRPFQGANAVLVSSAILRDDPPSLTSVRGDVPPELQSLLTKCLEKDPRQRYQNATEVAEALRGLTTSAPDEALDVPPPRPSTPLLGREEDLRQAVERIDQGARLLTVTGYGGTGKTRFSIELYRRLAPRFPGGAAFVSLASVTEEDEVLPAIGVQLAIAEAHGRSAEDALCTVIADRTVLLILDNLEQVLDAASAVASLVSRCPNLQVVATSRAPLKVSAESEFQLPPLALPDSSRTSLEELLESPAIALFVQRAQKANAGFRLSDSNADAVREICRQLDGLPLAIELAAARVRILDPNQLVQRLDHALDLLSSGDRDLPLRQKTLRATISWSYSLLDSDEQRLLRSCSVFREGWTFEAMEQICYDDASRWRAVDELESLVEKGLVRVDGSSQRYGLLETIRAFAAEQLHASGEVVEMQPAHAHYFVHFTGKMATEFRGPGQVSATRRVRADHANELAALSWCLATANQRDDSLESALLLCGHLDWFWHVGGQHNTAREVIDRALELAADREPTRGRGLCQLAAGMVSITTGEWDCALREWTAGHDDGIAIGDEEIASEGSMGMGYVHLSCGRLEEAAEPLQRAIELARSAKCEFMESLSMAAEGMRLFQCGQLDEGEALVQAGWKIQERNRDCEGGGIALSFLAQMQFARGNAEAALELYEKALHTFEGVGDRPEIARVHCETGWTALASDDPVAAQSAFRSAVLAYEEVGSPRGTGLALLGLAAVEAAKGNSERAVTIAAAANALTERAGVVCDHPMDPGVSERIAQLEVSIDETAVEAMVEEAREMSPAAVLQMLEL